ncbi:hypothetical protein Pla144_08660 [Bythopirellula polymerisocia]|uniref:Uncharacterized protein n=1 Tax=Bythopirellula polymerisocia TaxID=2528003 RepID=A0A5C6CZR2_9BACT|nr:hypothetical protein Pla144_08660 [Bythopirellula polymerisocia]
MEPIPEVLPSFVGKTVTFYSRSWQSANVLGSITSPCFEMQAGRLFVVGEAATSSVSWARGAHSAVAWDEVSSYLVLDTHEYQRQKDLHEKNRGSNKGSTAGGLFSFLRRQ